MCSTWGDRLGVQYVSQLPQPKTLQSKSLASTNDSRKILQPVFWGSLSSILGNRIQCSVGHTRRQESSRWYPLEMECDMFRPEIDCQLITDLTHDDIAATTSQLNWEEEIDQPARVLPDIPFLYCTTENLPGAKPGDETLVAEDFLLTTIPPPSEESTDAFVSREVTHPDSSPIRFLAPSVEELEECLTDRPRNALNSWYKKINSLSEFKEKHGHCNVPQKQGGLGVWVNKMREEKKKHDANRPSSLNEIKIRHLDSMGFSWRTYSKGSDCWKKHLQALRDFKRENGHCKVPTRQTTLGRFVTSLRHSYKAFQKGRKSKLTEEKIQILDELGFCWDAAVQSHPKTRRIYQNHQLSGSILRTKCKNHVVANEASV